MTVPFTCSHRQIFLCLLLETSLPKASTGGGVYFYSLSITIFLIIVPQQWSLGCSLAMGLSSTTDVGVGLRDCTSLLFAAAV